MRHLVSIVCLMSLSLFGCTGSTQIKTPQPAPGAQVLGESEGVAVGFNLFIVGPCIPIGQNGRFERAVREALLRKGGTALVDPTVEERWFWTPVGIGMITTVRGTVIR